MTNTIQLTGSVQLPDGVSAQSATATVILKSSAPPPPIPSGAVYWNGHFGWGGDWSYPQPGTVIDYAHVDASAPSGAGRCISVVSSAMWAAWQPYAVNENFDLTPYTAFAVYAKPTRPNQRLSVYIEKVGDQPDGQVVTLDGYWDRLLQPGQWSKAVVPLTAFQLASLNILKFAIQDQSGYPANVLYYDQVEFV